MANYESLERIGTSCQLIELNLRRTIAGSAESQQGATDIESAEPGELLAGTVH